MERFKNKRRVIIVGVMAITLSLIFFWPIGVINFEKFEGDNLLIAEREGAANCHTSLKLKANKQFVEKNICFGVSEVRGNYSIKGDSIFFSNVRLGRDVNEYYQFAVIKQSDFQNKKIIGELKRFMNYNDTLPHDLFITKNELKN
jgi:hypothetical protein